MNCGSMFCATIDAYELFIKFILGCFFTCLGEIIDRTVAFLQTVIIDIIAVVVMIILSPMI